MQNKQKTVIKMLGIITCICLLLAALGVFSACSEGAIIYKKVGTKEELLAMKEGKSYRLTADIDLENEVWKPITLKAFDGDGHTISNCMINEAVNNSYYAGGIAFFSKIRFLKNVTFEYVTVMATDVQNVAVAAAEINSNIGGAKSTFSNITLKSCDIVVSHNRETQANVGNVLAYVISSDATVQNCLVEDCSITMTSTNKNVHVGGVVGYSFSNKSLLSNCTVSQCEFSVSASHKFGEINVGGIAGSTENNFSGCLSEHNTFDVKRTADSEYAMRVGGIVGYNRDTTSAKELAVKQCASVDNDFSCSSYQNYSLGGIVGRSDGQIVDCLSDSNTLAATLTKSTGSANVGGICGVSYNTIRSSITQNCTIQGSNYSGSKISAAGIVGTTEGSVAYCAVTDTTVTGANADIFSAQSNTIFNSYINGSPSVSNVNDVAIIDDWSKVISRLSLDSNVWEQDSDENLHLKSVGVKE